MFWLNLSQLEVVCWKKNRSAPNNNKAFFLINFCYWEGSHYSWYRMKSFKPSVVKKWVFVWTAKHHPNVHHFKPIKTTIQPMVFHLHQCKFIRAKHPLIMWEIQQQSSRKTHASVTRSTHTDFIRDTVSLAHTSFSTSKSGTHTCHLSRPFLEFLFSTLCKTHMQINPFEEITTTVSHAIKAIDVAPTHQPPRWSAKIKSTYPTNPCDSLSANENPSLESQLSRYKYCYQTVSFHPSFQRSCFPCLFRCLQQKKLK